MKMAAYVLANLRARPSLRLRCSHDGSMVLYPPLHQETKGVSRERFSTSLASTDANISQPDCIHWVNYSERPRRRSCLSITGALRWVMLYLFPKSPEAILDSNCTYFLPLSRGSDSICVTRTLCSFWLLEYRVGTNASTRYHSRARKHGRAAKQRSLVEARGFL